MSKLRVAVVGAGHLGRIHARLLGSIDGAELVSVADPAPEARDRINAELGVVSVSDFRSLVGSIDAAVVAVPTKLHHGVAGELIRRGVHVLVEKPLAATLAEAQELAAEARRAGVVLQVGHVEQFNPAFVAARPHLGQPKFIDAIRAGEFSFRSTDVGVVLDLMIHDLDLVLSLAGAMPRKVQALGLALMGRHEDVAHARLEFAGGLVANLGASRVSRQPCRTMQVWTERGMASIDFGNRTASLVRPSDTVLRRELDVERMTPDTVAAIKGSLLAEHLPVQMLPVEPRNAIADELADFVQAIASSREPRVGGRQACDALALAEQILDAMDHHAWDGHAGGRVGPLAMPRLPILRGPHWHDVPQSHSSRREAG